MIEGDVLNIKEHDVVRLKDGREGTVLYLYDRGKTLMLEITDESGRTIEQPFVSASEVGKVLYSA